MLQYRRLNTAADINDAAGTDVETFDAPVAGKINTEACYVTWTEATGSQTSAQGIISIDVAGTEVATLTASQSGAVGDAQVFVPDGTAATSADPWVTFDAGDVILTEIATQASGGTVTGEAEVYLAIEWGF